MKISILTLFPEMFVGPFDHSILKRTQQKDLLIIEYINIRDFGIGKHKIVDDTPYGGGVGMVMRVDVIDKAIDQAKCDQSKSACTERILLMDPRGETFSQKKAKTFASYDHLIIVCGHYEGVDERVNNFIDETLSIGDYVLTGGELPSMVIVDAITRLLPGAITAHATDTESFSLHSEKGEQLLEHPHYTRPETYKKNAVPKVLLSGNHKEIIKWRNEQSEKRTTKHRPDLLQKDGAKEE